MFTPSYGTCISCLNHRLIVVKAGYCAKCNKLIKDGKRHVYKENDLKGNNRNVPFKPKGSFSISKMPKKTPEKIKKTIKKATGEAQLFRDMAENQTTYKCRCCSVNIPALAPHNFSHLLAKSTFPAFRLLKANIWICCFDCHHQYDFGDRSAEKFEEKRKEAFLLKQFYYSLSHEQRKSGIEWLTEAFRQFKANATE